MEFRNLISIPSGPLPSVRILLNALFSSQKSGGSWHEWFSKGNFYLYSRGMWALTEAIRALLTKRGKEEGIVWFPDYFCNGALIGVRQLQVKVCFYPTLKNLEPDWDILETEIRKINPPDIFVIVDYFGFPNVIEETGNFCQKYEIDLIEDAAHAFSPCIGLGPGEHPVIFSLRKVLPLSEGGILVTSKELDDYIRKQKMILIDDSVVEWFIKRFVQKVMVTLEIPWHRFWKIKENQYEDYSSIAKGWTVITSKLLIAMFGKFEEIIRKRRENYNYLITQLLDDNTVPLFPTLPESVCPYVLPVLVNRNQDSILGNLHNSGIPAISWPDLPPEVLKNNGKHQGALWLRSHIILFPVHQSLTRKQIDYIANTYRYISKSITI
ncbi:MAG: hypothetical protein FJZ16_01940 [Candidatus Omnitrophica bacterium]|nr:hypothetical protein [Candidatus Omnitrophota bacterium]